MQKYLRLKKVIKINENNEHWQLFQMINLNPRKSFQTEDKFYESFVQSDEVGLTNSLQKIIFGVFEKAWVS